MEQAVCQVKGHAGQQPGGPDSPKGDLDKPLFLSWSAVRASAHTFLESDLEKIEDEMSSSVRPVRENNRLRRKQLLYSEAIVLEHNRLIGNSQRVPNKPYHKGPIIIKGRP